MNENRESGVALILVVVISIAFLAIAAGSLQLALVHSLTQTVQLDAFEARQIAESGAAQALARIKEGGIVTPMSGGGTAAQWVSFATGTYYYYATFDPTSSVSTIRAWGRVAADPAPSACTSSPDSSAWDGTGWMLQGVEVTVRSVRFIPESPVYFGNGGIERPMGGFEWSSTANPTDPSTWTPITGSPSSYQSSWVPFELSALDHPVDYIYNGGSPSPPGTTPHPYKIWASQNLIGQFNTEAWFANSAGSGNDPTVTVSPGPTSSYYDSSDRSSPDYPYPVDSTVPDVQDFASALWNQYGSSSSVTRLGSGNHSGTYGNLSAPGITFVTGTLGVSAGSTFRGCGILVIRDDYDPNTQTNNTPSTRAMLEIEGRFEWTGLVIVAGWAPNIEVEDDAGAEATIVGALFGEDSVQSGGEISLDSATISLNVQNRFRVLYSNALFQPGGLVYDFLPLVRKEVVGIRDI